MKKCIVPAGLVLLVALAALATADDLPTSLDWRDNNGNFVTAPKDEGDCASCWAFAAAALAESYNAIANGDANPTIDLSEQTLVSCAGDGSCTSGGDIGQALDFVRDTGLPPESCFPYEGEQESCNRCADWESNVTKIPGWSWVDEDQASDEAIKSALLNGPVTAWLHVHSELEDYTGGVYTCQGDYVGDHFVLLIGWDDSQSAWIAKNNWGTDWGENGFFHIAYDSCGIGKWVAQVSQNAGDDDDADDDDDSKSGGGSCGS